MYELERVDSGADGPLADVTVRYRDAGNVNREVTLAVDGDEACTDDTRFAACVAEFALVLRQSQYRGSASLGSVLARLCDLGDYIAGDVYRQEFREIVLLAKESGLYDTVAEPGGASAG